MSGTCCCARVIAALIVSVSLLGFAQVPPSSVRSILLEDRVVTYEIRGGYALVNGDIILGAAADVAAAARAQHEGKNVQPHSSIALFNPSGRPSRWPNATMYYTIDPDIPNQQRILDGIQHWNDRTSMRILPRTGEPNYVRFQRNQALDAACSSALGMVGGEQTIQTTDGCTTGAVVHELGHAWGLLHEQQRNDRNRYITVLSHNIDKRFTSNFEQGGVDVSYFDYGSIMHYPSTGFTRNGLDSMETVPVGIPIGQLLGLSAGDIDAVHRQYGIPITATVVTTVPEGLRIVIDGAATQSPQSFNWTPGSSHTISVAPQQGTDPRYVFVGWNNGGEATQTVIASADQTVLSAVFQLRHILTVGVAAGSGSAAVLPVSPDNYYPDRQPVRVTAIPQGSEFVGWTGTTNLQANGYGLSSAIATVQVGLANSRFLANFIPVASTPVSTIDSNPPGRIVTVDGATYRTPVRFGWAPGSSHTLTLTDTQPAGNNTTRHDFTGWEDGTTGMRRVTAGTEARTYTANFTTSYLLTVGTLGMGDVTTSPPSPDGFYPAGSIVRLSATPASGSALRYWLGDLAGGDLTPTIKMDEQRAVTAYFAVPISFRILNAASYLANPASTRTGTVVAPGELVVIFGSNIGTVSLVLGETDSNGNLMTTLGGTRVLFDTDAAPLVYTSQNQLSAVVPYALAGRTSTTVRVVRDGTALGSLGISVGATTPALLTSNSSGTGIVAAVNQDGSIHSTSAPAAPGSTIVLYATGAGALAETVPDGQIMGSRLVRPRAPVYVRVGKLDAEVMYAGSAPGLVNGVLQVNARIPAEALSDPAAAIQLIVGDIASPPGTTIAIK